MKIFRNRNFIIIAALTAVVALVLILALCLRPAPALPADARQVEFASNPEDAAAAATDDSSVPQTDPTAGDTSALPADPTADDTSALPADPTADGAAAYVLCSLPASGQYGIIPLPKEGEISYPIHQSFTDGTQSENILHLTPEGFYMEFSTCKNQNCVGQGTVTLENRDERVLQNCVICLPNQVMAELYTAEEIAEMNPSVLQDMTDNAQED